MNTEVIVQMIEYIEGRLTEALSLDDIAKHVNYSPYYCSTSFRKVLGTSIKEYISKRRLYLAASDLESYSDGILDLAMKYGYSSQEAFTRAFVNAFGVTPFKFKKEKMVVANYHERSFTLKSNVIKHDVMMNLKKEISEKYSANALHVLNGQCMMKTFEENQWMNEEAVYVPFNEAMCWGEAEVVIFSDDFIRRRSQSLKSDEAMYREIVIQGLEPLFNQSFDTIVLWFGTDMFCQINLLTMLGYLDQIDFKGDVLYCLEDEVINEMIPEAKVIDVEGYFNIYKTVVCQKEMIQGLPPIMYQGVKAYLNYNKEDSEINKYIKTHIGDDDLLHTLMKTFPEYGLGDLQFKMMIEANQS